MKILSFFNVIERNIWGDKIDTNPYLATLSILFIALMGACNGGSEYINDLIETNIYTPPVTATLGFLILLFGFNLTESIIATDSAKIATLRALMLLFIHPVAYVLGYVLSVIMLVIITIIVAIALFIMLIKAMLGGGVSGGGKKIVLDDGTVLRNGQSDLLGGGASFDGDDGSRYHTDDGQTFRKSN